MNEAREKAYIVFDGRARHDVDDATIFEVMDEGLSRKRAISNFNQDYADMDAVLFEYDVDDAELINGEEVKV